MATTIVFDLITQLVETCKAAAPAGVQVYDGQGASDDPGNFIMVGVHDPDSEDETDSAEGEQAWKGVGVNHAAEERGIVPLCALAWTGDAGSDAQRAVRQTVRDMVAGIDAALKADPNLGGTVPGLHWVRYGQSYSLRQWQNTEGARAVFDFEIAYFASI